MNFVFKLYASLAIVFLLSGNLNDARKKNPSERCSMCNILVTNFVEGIKKTQKGNFGGGNTDWEDRKLGNYLTSETRFEEIIENICSETECHALLESVEDTLLSWFKNKQNLDNFESKLKEKICINDLKYCCSSGRFGPNCEPCPQNSAGLICSGNGRCQGEGTRGIENKDGKCDCNAGYQGDLCDQCQSEFYYEANKNTTFIQCLQCHTSCKVCTGPAAAACSSCRDGWKMNEDLKLCEDINECLVKENACKSSQFCENSMGSYICHDCDQSCEGCTAHGNNKCLECGKGYRSTSFMSLVCEDINECEETPNICGENKKCLNKPGSFECKEEQKLSLNDPIDKIDNNNINNSINAHKKEENDYHDDDDYDDEDESNQINSNIKTEL